MFTVLIFYNTLLFNFLDLKQQVCAEYQPR